MRTVTVRYGIGVWAYWLDQVAGAVIADRIYQPTASNFAGKLNCLSGAGMEAQLEEKDFAEPEQQPCIFSDRFPVQVTIPKEK